MLLGVAKFAIGILGLAWFMWTPRTGMGLLVFVVLFALLIVMGIVLSPRKGTGWWPDKPGDH